MNKAAENYEKARSLSETVTEKEKLMIEAVFAHAEFNNEKVLEILHTIIEKYPRDKWAHLELSKYYREREQYSEVIKHSEIVLALDPSWGDAYEELAFAYSNSGDDAKALEYLERGSSAIPGDPNMNLSTGFFYVKTGKLDEGIRRFKDALDIKPDFNIENYIAYAYAMKEDYAETFAWINKYITAAPTKGKKSDGYLLKGYYHFWLGNSGQALVDMQKSWDLFAEMGGRNWAVEYVMGRVHAEKGEFRLGRSSFQNWYDDFMKSYPQAAQDWKSYGSFYLHRGLGRIEVKKGNIESARSHLKEMEALMPDISSPQKLQGYNEMRSEISIAEKSYKKAISALKDADQMKMPWIWNTQPIIAYNGDATKALLAQAYKENGDLDQAIEEYDRLTDSNPENRDGRLISPINHYYLAVVYEMKGIKSKAIKSYERFLSLGENADLWTAELKDARKRLAELKE
jgi:tetratricopeptide (TPR) repeat protein